MTAVVPALPPRPDPETGIPLPPHAPAFFGKDRPRHSARRGAPPPPDGCGETLAWHRPAATGQARKLAAAVLAMTTLAVVVSLIITGSLILYWPAWPAIAVAAWLLAGPLDMPALSAGADWLQWSRRNRWWGVRDGPRAHIRCYELREITALIHQTHTVLTLTDNDGRTCTKTREELQRDRIVWDLLYNGILHSVANGAKITSTAAEVLRLPK